MKLAHAEFAYNRAHSSNNSHFLFEVVYGVNLFVLVDLIPLVKGDMVEKDAKKRVEPFKKVVSKLRNELRR